MTIPDKQTLVYENARGRIVAMDSAYDVSPANRARDIVINASYCGVLPARFIGECMPRGSIGVDCGIGPAGASIAGLWYLEALGIPAAVADVMTAILGNGVDLYEAGRISFLNQPAADCGVTTGMSVRDAARLLLDKDPERQAAAEVQNRQVIEEGPDGRCVICADSIAFGQPEDRNRNVLVTAGHTGRSAVPYIVKFRPHGFICSDGGMARDRSGIVGLEIVNAAGIPGRDRGCALCTHGSGWSTYHDGTISAANELARACGVEIGMAAADAATKLLMRNRDV